MEAEDEARMFNTIKGVTTGVKFKLCLLPPTEENRNLAPVLEKPPIAYYPGE